MGVRGGEPCFNGNETDGETLVWRMKVRKKRKRRMETEKRRKKRDEGRGFKKKNQEGKSYLLAHEISPWPSVQQFPFYPNTLHISSGWDGKQSSPGTRECFHTTYCFKKQTRMCKTAGLCNKVIVLIVAVIPASLQTDIAVLSASATHVAFASTSS